MFWDPAFEKVAAIAGAPVSQIRLISTLLLSYPLASIYVSLPHGRPNIAHIYSIIISFIYLIPILGLKDGLGHLLFSCTGTYGIVISLRGPTMPWTVFIFCMGHLLINHIRRLLMAIPTTEIEITFTQMVLVENLITFAWNVHDGRRKEEELDDSQKATRLRHVPNPLAFFGYCFFFPAMLIGPCFDYSTYDSLVQGTLYKDVIASDPKGKQGRQPVGRRRVAYLHLIIGLGFLGLYSVYAGTGSYERILKPEWDTWSLLKRFGFVQFAGLMARTKYYAVWSMSEGACILTGIGFNGFDPKTGRTLWNRVRNVNIVSIESAESFKVLFDNWNCRTNVWLRDCVYKRLTTKGQKPGTMQSMATFVTSAIWHGIEPGYYLAFITAGLLTSLGRQFRHFVRPYFLPSTPTSSKLPKKFYDLLGWLFVQTNLNYSATPFMLLSFSTCMKAWQRQGWYSHVLILASMAFFRFGGRRKLRAGLQGRPGTVKVQKEPNPSFKVSPPSPETDAESEGRTERKDRDLRWVKDDMDDMGGQGVHPDAGFVDQFVRGAETPYNESPATTRSASPISPT